VSAAGVAFVMFNIDFLETMGKSLKENAFASW